MLNRHQWADKEYDLAWTVAVVSDRNPDDVVKAYGGDPSSPMDQATFEESWVPEDNFGEYFHVQILTHGGYVIAIEQNGWTGSIPEVARRASAGGRFFSVHWNVNGVYRIVQAAEGQVSALFDPMSANGPVELGEVRPAWASETVFEVDHLRSTCLHVMEQQTGLAFDRNWLDRRLPLYRIPPPRVLLAGIENAWIA
ncbi:DUF6461 domain-containing protein [Actinokineospora sp.]|uniref:DUF6461 domain-containing protein n=1 Tax=Actinokineospora sp. TaxID=1872133 RepID=UPI004037E32A